MEGDKACSEGAAQQTTVEDPQSRAGRRRESFKVWAKTVQKRHMHDQTSDDNENDDEKSSSTRSCHTSPETDEHDLGSSQSSQISPVESSSSSVTRNRPLLDPRHVTERPLRIKRVISGLEIIPDTEKASYRIQRYYSPGTTESSPSHQAPHPSTSQDHPHGARIAELDAAVIRAMQQHERNGTGPPGAGNAPLANSTPISNVGHQADMMTLWNCVEQLSSQLADNRRETALLMESAKELAARYAAKCADQVVETNEEEEPNRAQLQVEIFNLQQELVNRDRLIEAHQENDEKNWELIRKMQRDVEQMLSAVRPYAHNQVDYVNALHRHYNKLIQAERDINTQHVLDKLDQQEHWARAVAYQREAIRANSKADERWIRRVAGLKYENRVLRRELGREEGWESGEDDDPLVAAAERLAPQLPAREAGATE